MPVSCGMNKKPIPIFARIFILLWLATFYGCSVNLKWFVRNYSGKPVTLTLRYQDQKYKPAFLLLKTLHVTYRHELLKIEQTTADSLTDSLGITQLKDLVYHVILP